jgi:hypothetical protein
MGHRRMEESLSVGRRIGVDGELNWSKLMHDGVESC